jgi:hypothetical protein
LFLDTQRSLETLERLLDTVEDLHTAFNSLLEKININREAAQLEIPNGEMFLLPCISLERTT